MDPDDFSGLVVHDCCKAGMFLFMACFINLNSFKIFILHFGVFLLGFLNMGNDGSDSSPVDCHLLTDAFFQQKKEDARTTSSINQNKVTSDTLRMERVVWYGYGFEAIKRSVFHRRC
ncbi:hypothetical protein AAK899_00370 [Erysipelotrichaceae bacterium 51-3]